MERKTLARGLVVFALACFGLLSAAASASAEQTVQGTQSSDGSSASTGNVEGTNSSSFNGGPQANGTEGASSQQNGSNTGSTSQSASAQTGDPVAGAQVTGAVADDVTVQNQNNATNPNALSGDATVENTAEANLGPAAVVEDGTPQASQIGDNSVDVTQAAIAETGDAVGGAQVTGIVGGGEHTVQNQNTAVCDTGPCAESGDAFAGPDVDFPDPGGNRALVNLGPYAGTEDRGFTTDTSIDATASQIGDNDAVITQAAEAGTGDALFGSQVAGVVGGSATVQQQNSSDNNGGDAAVSGEAVADNAAGGGFEVNGSDDLLPAYIGPYALSTTGTGQSTQNGSNSADIAQEVEAQSGDALSGGQVTGGVGDQSGFFTVQNQQASEDDESVSGDADGSNVTVLNAGPVADSDDDTVDSMQSSQVGDNDVNAAQSTTLGTGDALAGAQVTGAVGYDDVTVQNQNSADSPNADSGDFSEEGGTFGEDVGNVFAGSRVGPYANGGSDATVEVSQVGDNALSVDQTIDASTGDAIAGGQVTGVVATDDGSVTVQNQNTTDDADATSGDADDLGNVVAGNFVGAIATTHSTGTAQAGQIGDNAAVIGQSAVVTTGDAVGGSQVTGVVGGDEVTVQNQNTATNTPDAESGEIDNFGQVVAALFLGPFATTEGSSDSNQASQNGDNTADIAQALEASSGDAVAGAQVTGVVASGSDVVIQNQNTATDSSNATSGDVDGEQVVAEMNLGPLVEIESSGTGQASQTGDNAAAVAQAAVFATGDAVAGAQVTGAVAGDGSSITIQNQNTADDADAESGEIGDDEAGNVMAVPTLGVLVEVEGDGDAEASQIGDNAFDASQSLETATGDAVAAAQVTGAVAGDGSEITIQNQNDGSSSDADSGDNEGVNVIANPRAGTFAQIEGDGTGQATQNGDNDVVIGQLHIGATGDAVGGAQVTGAVAGDDSAVTVQNQNTADSIDTESGEFAGGGANVIASPRFGPFVETDQGPSVGEASQIGDNTVDIGQSLALSTGDAVAGSQVTGVVTGSGSDVTVQNQNSADDADAISGDNTDEAGNTLANLHAGPQAAHDNDGTAEASQIGDNAVAVSQTIDITTGDAVGGSQVTGVVAGAGSVVEVQNQNTSFESFGESGDIGEVSNNIAAPRIGPNANLDDFGTAEATQNGDNSFAVDQAITVGTGDAIAGGQVTGVVAGAASDVTVQNQNSSDDDDAISGDIDGVSNGIRAGFVGPLADSGNTDSGSPSANASQIGDNTGAVDQTVEAASGDAVAGAQVTGAVAGAGSDVTVQNQNTATSANADSGNVEGVSNGLNAAFYGPQALSEFGTAQAEQVGDNLFTFSQDVSVASGDAVAGAQVTGIVGPEDAIVQVSNTDDGSAATSGITDGENDASGNVGPLAEVAEDGDNANSNQVGDSAVDGSQGLSSETGDAVAGAQVNGSVGSSGAATETTTVGEALEVASAA